MRLKIYILIIIGILFIYSCDDQWFSSGEIIQQEFEIDSFTTLFIEDNFDIYLIQDTICKVVVEAGKNLIPNIDLSHDADHTLTISNNNQNDWLKDYDRIKLYISIIELKYLKVNACCKVESTDTLETIELQAFSLDEYSDFDIKIKTNNLYFVTSESSGGYYKFSGEAINWGFWARGSSIIESRDLENTRAIVKSESIGNCYIHANNILDVAIYNTGNIYYTGTPQTISFLNEQAKKQLIKLN
jgi:hypothetical protein